MSCRRGKREAEKGLAMTKLVADAALHAKLQGLKEMVEICDESGNVLGFFHPIMRLADVDPASLPPPISEEEAEQLRRQPARLLKDILEDLQRQ